MKRRRLISWGLALAVGMLAAPPSTFAATDDPPPPPAAADSTSQLSPPVRGVVKMATSGVPEEVIKVYIQSSASTFNLTPEEIVHLQGIGVSGAVTTTMLNHDKALRDNPPISAPPAAAPIAPAAAPVAPAVGAAPQSNDYAVYNNLAPYGSWTELPQYGWCWQPYSWIGYNYYPWTWPGYGYWWNYPGHGWCWFPHSHFYGFNQHYASHAPYGVNHWAGTHTAGNHAPVNHTPVNRVGVNQMGVTHVGALQARAQAFNSSFASRSVSGMNHGTFGVRSSPGMSTFGAGVHGSVGGSFHGGVGGGFHGGVSSVSRGGAVGGFHGGGGGGGSHGGGGHR